VHCHEIADLDAFARLPGVGGAKLARYAQTFLAVIAAHRRRTWCGRRPVDGAGAGILYERPIGLLITNLRA